MEPTVTIVGAYGATGAVVAHELSRTTAFRLVLAGRDQKRLEQLAREVGRLAETACVDVHSDDSLAAVCARSDAVVNCAGPFSAVRDRVARSAFRHGCHYVDPGSYEVVAPAMADVEDELRRRQLCFVSSAGWIPGLDVVFLRYVDEIARRELDSIETMRLYSGDRNPWSETGIADVVWWVAHSARPGLFEHGAWAPRGTLTSPRVHNLPPPAGAGLVLPVFKAELERLAAVRRYPAIWAYHAMLSPSSVAILGAVRTFGKRWPQPAAAALRASLDRSWRRHGSAGAAIVVTDGRRAGRRRRVCGVLNEPRGYWPTGAVAAAAARAVVQGDAAETGSIAVCDAFEPARFMRDLARRGVAFEVTVDGRGLPPPVPL